MHSHPANDMPALGQMLRQARQRQGLRQDELALAAGVSTRSVHAVENGKATAQVAILLRLIDALGLELALIDPAAHEGG